MNDELLLDSPEYGELFEPHWTVWPPAGERTPLSPPPAPDFNVLKELHCMNPDVLRPTLAALTEGHADCFDPVRFRFIEALAQKALNQRPPVARAVEKKALQALSDYLGVYFPARERAASLMARVASETLGAEDEIGRLFNAGNFEGVERLAARLCGHENKKQGALAALTREMLQRRESGEFAPTPSFEDELRQQELDVMQSTGGVTTGNADRAGTGQDGSDELSAMRYFRESLIQRNSERRVARAIQDGPENPGPLNSQALIIRSLSMMQDLSPGYAHRFVSYMDTLLWLEQVDRTAALAKSKGAGRRKS